MCNPIRVGALSLLEKCKSKNISVARHLRNIALNSQLAYSLVELLKYFETPRHASSGFYCWDIRFTLDRTTNRGFNVFAPFSAAPLHSLPRLFLLLHTIAAAAAARRASIDPEWLFSGVMSLLTVQLT